MLKAISGFFFQAVMAASMVGCNSSVHAVTGASSSSSSSSSSSDAASEMMFTGNSGTLRINDDTVEARNGVVTVNGVSYGPVNEQSVVKYTVRGNVKTLSVDGVIRKPVR